MVSPTDTRLCHKDHMYRMAILVLTLDPIPDCDMGKVLRMCLVHDLAECRVGDITPDDGIDVDEKHRLEREAITSLTQLLAPTAASTILHLYQEYEQHESLEARLTKDLDIFDFVHQAFVYEKRAVAAGKDAHSLRLENFFQTVTGIRNTQVKQLADRLLSDRRLFLLNNAMTGGSGDPVPINDTAEETESE